MDGVAIVGMAGRFPGAATVAEFWANLVAGKDSIRRSAAPGAESGGDGGPLETSASGTFAGADLFDAAFFGITAAEALLIDPQQRVFLELCWNALENAGIDAHRFDGRVGVYAGVSNNGYRKLLEENGGLLGVRGEFAAMLANEKDYVATRVAHRIGLTGPAISVYTACSTSLVAVIQAWYALMTWQCDAALAGGINVIVAADSSGAPVDGGMESPDGCCRPFDAAANGTVFSSGGGVVVLKRLADAVAQHDTIWAVIRGVGINNDGADKASFTAPSVSGQAGAIALALASAGVDADSIGYVEAHGTGTALGDPIEVEALTDAFREHSQRTQYCWLGSLKGNIGHLVAGAGVSGLIKAALSLHHRHIPRSLHFREVNPEINIGASPFKVADRNVDWEADGTPRRAGVSSFGVGGTNAHVILEEAPALEPRSAPTRAVIVLPLSARNEQGLRDRAEDLSKCLSDHGGDELADIAWSLATGRREMQVRGAVVANSIDDARRNLARIQARAAVDGAKPAFFFPGQGSQHAAMAAQLIASEPVFAEAFERCCALAAPWLEHNLRDMILDERPATQTLLDRTLYAQPALFAVEYALARLWLSWDVRPVAMVGHSLGEYVAACIAGVFSLEDAIMIVTARARAMDQCPAGAMLAVRSNANQLKPWLSGAVAIAAMNAPDLTVVSGSSATISQLEAQLQEHALASTRLRVSHAFHSELMSGAIPGLRRALEDVRLHAPELPFHSSVTGRPITEEEATSREYWCRQMLAPVQFASASAQVLSDPQCVALEVGPRQILSRTLLGSGIAHGRVVASLPARPGVPDAEQHLAAAVGNLWSAGCHIDWDRYCAAADRRRVTLPGYRFRGQRYWIDASPATAATTAVGQHTSDAGSGSSPEPMGSPLRAELHKSISDLLGSPLAVADEFASFLDLGLDSLALTQLALGVEQRFGMRLKFRRLMDDLETPAKLLRHIESHRPLPVSCQCSALGRQDTEAPTGQHFSDNAVPAAVATDPKAAPCDADESAFGAQARITRRIAIDLDERQRTWLEGFSARYARRTGASKAFAERNRAAMADPRVVTGFNPLWKELVYPIVVERSRGAELWDIDGNNYVDLLNAFGANFLGYQPDIIRHALADQIEKGFEIGPQHALAADVTELIRDLTGVERVAFCNTGSEAVMGAMRIARTVTGRKTIVIFKNSYHGIFDEVIVRGTAQLQSIAAAPGILASAVENVLVLEYGTDAALATIRQRARELAAVMLEPVQARNPMLQPRDFVREVRGICHQHGCALIFDEVITGFRVAPGGAQEFYGVRADLVTYGKIIGGGMPLAVIAGAGRWMDALDGGTWRFGDDSQPEAGVTYFAGTFVRHPLALAAARATLTFLKEQGAQLQQTVNERTAQLVARLNAFFVRRKAPMHAVCFSSLWRIQIDRDQPFAELFFYAVRERGLHLYGQFNCFLSTAHDASVTNRIVDTIEAATNELLQAGMLTDTSGVRIVPFDVVGSLATSKTQSGAPMSPDVPAQRGAIGPDVPDEIPLTDAQAEKWLACQFGDTANVAYNESQLLVLDGALDRAALMEAIRSVCSRHEAFALSVTDDGDRFRISPDRLPEPTFVELPDPVDLQQHCASVLRKPFDLTVAPLARFELIRLSQCRHALLIVAHHLVFDGWSAAIFLDELARSYSARIQGRVAQLPTPESFRAYAMAEQRRRTGASAMAQLDYWKRQVADAADALVLPTDRPRAVQPDFAAGTIFHDFSPALTAAIRALSRRCSVTLHTTLLAAFALVCERLSGQGEFTVGIPFAGQAAAGSQSLVGDGVNTLPIPLRIDLDETFGMLVRRLHRQLLDIADNQDLTLYTLLNAIDRPQRADLSSLIDVIFNLNPRVPALHFYGLACEVRDCAKVALVKDLFFNLTDRGDTITLDVHYRKALFDAATIERWIGHYETVLHALLPDVRVRDVALLDMAQRKALIEDYNATASAYDHGHSIVTLIAEKARGFSARVAVESQGREMTFEGLLLYSQAIARGLIQGGVGRGDVVGICMARQVELPACLLGILAAGAAYVPIDAGNPAERMRLIIADAGLRHVLVDNRHQAPAVVRETCTVLEHAQVAANGGSASALAPVAADALAYIIYTSGSTGAPKGVQVRHRNVVNLLTGIQQRCKLEQGDVLCAITPLSFDIAGLELYLPLLVGARVLVAGDHERQDPDALINLMRARGATVLQLTPSWLRVLAASGRARNWPRLRILVGGEELARGLAEAALAHCRELWNLYGPTETTIWSTAYRVSHGKGPVPIGRPIANTRIYILDAQGRLAPPGARGEIWIGGDGVADGYLRRPDLTAARFRPDPFAGQADRMYATGDIGSWRGGELFFHGRIDNQTKLRGFRIEYGEVEAAALSQPGVSAAVASVHESDDGQKRLVLYVVASDTRPDFASSLRAVMRARLPLHMVPSHIELLDALPQTRHGKIDRKSLPPLRPAEIATSLPATRSAPEADDPLTASLLPIWRELLRIPTIDADGNFFDLGGDSLLGVELLQRAHAITGVALPLSSLLTAQTVRQQAQAFRAAGVQKSTPQEQTATRAAESNKWSPLVCIQEGGELPPLFCVHALGGNVLNYVPLARALGAGQPVFGLQAVGLDGISAPLLTIEQMALRYLPEITARFPHGPYYLAGGSMGGLIAFELARLLVARNERVAFVGLFDTPGPGSPSAQQHRPAGIAMRLRVRFRQARDLDAHGRWIMLRDALVRLVVRSSDAVRSFWHRRRGTPLPHDALYRELERIHLRADAAYCARPYAGRVTLFRASETEAEAASRTLGWDKVELGAIEIVDLPGTHATLIEQPRLAVALHAALARARASENGNAASKDPPQRRRTG